MRAMSGSLLCGCPDTHAVSAALAKLRKYDWRETSLAQLQAVWPTHLDGLDCDASGCTSVWSKDRIIANQCECCTTFFLGAYRGEKGSRSAHLTSIAINFSDRDRDVVISTAKELSLASGLGESDRKLIGSDIRTFSWQDVPRRLVCILDVSIRRSGVIWTLNFNFSQQPL